jgi:hypothetical protein
MATTHLSEPTVIEARRPGTCPACEQPIHVGDRITPDPFDGAGATWVHEKCPLTRAPRPVCTSCFMEIALNGECSC